MDVDGPYPSNFSHLFTSNVAPQPLEIASIQCEVEKLTKSISQVQLQLDRLQQLLRKLEGQRQGYRALLSPLRRLPPETLGEIIDSVLDLSKGDSTIPIQSPLITLCLVCKSWRNAALATPKLWSNLAMPGIPTSLRLDTVFRWFGRCKGVSKTLSIYGSPHDYLECAPSGGGGGCEFANLALAKLLTEGPVIDRLNVSCTSSQCFRNLVESMNSLKTGGPRPWDSIKSLEVGFHDAWNEPGPQDSHSDTIFHHIPPVSSLYLYFEDKEDMGADNGYHIHIPEIVLTNLTTFTFSCNWGVPMMLKILKSCTNVENLTLDFGGSWVSYHEDQDANRKGLSLPKVRSLHLDGMRVPDVVYLLPCLLTPSLVELHFSFYTGYVDPDAFTDLVYISDDLPPTLSSFVQASGCQGSLRKLRFDSANIPNPQLIHILVNFPFLTHLTFHNAFFDPTPFSDKYNYEPGERILPHILPHIEVLEVLRLPPDFPYDPIRLFAIERCRSRAGTLKKFTMTFRTHKPPDFHNLVYTFKKYFPIESTCFALV